MEIMKNLCSKEANGKNLAYSPLSIYAALGLLTFGAQGRTLNQLLEFLKTPNVEILAGFCSQLTNSLNETQTSGNSEGPKLSFVNRVFVEQTCVLNPKFRNIADAIFKAPAEAVDFRYKANEMRLMVNQWVEGNTNGLIKDLIPKEAVDEFTRIILVNALYFKGKWFPGQFDKSLTKDSAFYLHDGFSSVQVPFMHTRQTEQYISCYNGCKVLKLPYRVQAPATTNISMYIILPDSRNGIGELVEKASTDSASFLNQYLSKDPPLVPTRYFKIPKFKVTFDFEGKRVLKEMGLVLPFDEWKAELGGMVSTNVYVTSVIHKCFVEVDEEGTEAAASTAVICGAFGACAPLTPKPTVDFVADHPFMFMIKDNNTGLLLFTGYVLNPQLTS